MKDKGMYEGSYKRGSNIAPALLNCETLGKSLNLSETWLFSSVT